MEDLWKLVERLEIDPDCVTIVNNLGAGYITDYRDNVFCRWGHRDEGISVLTAYLEASIIAYDTEIEPNGRLSNTEKHDNGYYA